jgi:hypothetical protein
MYYFDCICGFKIVSPNPTGACPDCDRLFEIDWNGEFAPAAHGPLKPKAKA